MFIIKIQSISDVITNSSSEIFTIIDNESIQQLKEIISALIGDNFDDKFNIEIFPSRVAEDAYLDTSGDIPIEDWCLENNYIYDFPSIIGINITPKDPKDEQLALAINKIPYIFKTVEIYV